MTPRETFVLLQKHLHRLTPNWGGKPGGAVLLADLHHLRNACKEFSRVPLLEEDAVFIYKELLKYGKEASAADLPLNEWEKITPRLTRLNNRAGELIKYLSGIYRDRSSPVFMVQFSKERIADMIAVLVAVQGVVQTTDRICQEQLEFDGTEQGSFVLWFKSPKNAATSIVFLSIIWLGIEFAKVRLHLARAMAENQIEDMETRTNAFKKMAEYELRSLVRRCGKLPPAEHGECVSAAYSNMEAFAKLSEEGIKISFNMFADPRWDAATSSLISLSERVGRSIVEILGSDEDEFASVDDNAKAAQGKVLQLSAEE